MAETATLPKIRVELPGSTYKVLIYEDQPKALTATEAERLFNQYPEVKEIHERGVHSGRWLRKSKHKGVVRVHGEFKLLDTSKPPI